MTKTAIGMATLAYGVDAGGNPQALQTTTDGKLSVEVEGDALESMDTTLSSAITDAGILRVPVSAPQAQLVQLPIPFPSTVSEGRTDDVGAVVDLTRLYAEVGTDKQQLLLWVKTGHADLTVTVKVDYYLTWADAVAQTNKAYQHDGTGLAVTNTGRDWRAMAFPDEQFYPYARFIASYTATGLTNQALSAQAFVAVVSRAGVV